MNQILVDMRTSSVYQKRYNAFKTLYPALKEMYQKYEKMKEYEVCKRILKRDGCTVQNAAKE